MSDLATVIAEHLVAKFNPLHDELGRFAEGDGDRKKTPITEAVRAWTRESIPTRLAAERVVSGTSKHADRDAAAKSLIEHIQSEDATIYPTLYRGFTPFKANTMAEGLEAYKPGTKVDVPLTSATRDVMIANWFRTMNPNAKGVGVIMTMHDAPGIATGRLSRHPREKEVIVSGRFEVTKSKELKRTDRDLPAILDVTLKYVGPLAIPT